MEVRSHRLIRSVMDTKTLTLLLKIGTKRGHTECSLSGAFGLVKTRSSLQ